LVHTNHRSYRIAKKQTDLLKEELYKCKSACKIYCTFKNASLYCFNLVIIRIPKRDTSQFKGARALKEPEGNRLGAVYVLYLFIGFNVWNQWCARVIFVEPESQALKVRII